MAMVSDQPQQVIDRPAGVMVKEQTKLTENYKETPGAADKGALISTIVYNWPNHDV